MISHEAQAALEKLGDGFAVEIEKIREDRSLKKTLKEAIAKLDEDLAEVGLTIDDLFTVRKLQLMGIFGIARRLAEEVDD